MLLRLPRFGILYRNELGRESVQLAVCFFDLPVYKADPRNERLDMGAGCFNRSPGHLHSRFAQDIENMDGVEAPDAVALQKFGYRPLADARSLAGCGRQFPQVEQPWGAKYSPRLVRTHFVARSQANLPRISCTRFNSLLVRLIRRKSRASLR